MFEKIPVWYISASTGCSCCSYENFCQGFYKTEEEPKEIIAKWSQGIDNPLASQYAKYGRYSLHKTEAEILLDDGRFIVGGSVFNADNFGDKKIYW